MRNSYIIIFISLIGIVCYSYSLGGDFIWDDKDFVLNNPAIRSLKNITSFFTNPATLAKGNLAFDNYRPLVTLSYAIDYKIWSIDTFGYHLANTLFHIVNAILVFLLIDVLVKRKEIACFTALLFLIHPVQTEAVSWISGRSNVLFMFFYISSFLLYIGAWEIKSITKKASFYLLSLLFFCASLLSKEAAATLPVMILLHEILLRKNVNKSVIKRWLPYVAILCGYLFLRYHMLWKFFQRPYWNNSSLQTILTIPKVVKIYIQLLLFPVNLCVDRCVGLVKSSLNFHFLSGIAILVFFISTFFISYKKSRIAAFFVCWFLITLSPFLNIIPINILVAERFLYLPSIGLFALLSLLFFRLVDRNRIYYLPVILILLVLAFLTAQRNMDWKSELALYRSDIKVEPHNARLRNNLGIAYAEGGKKTEAEGEFKKAVEIAPWVMSSYINLGQLYLEQRRYEDAEDIINKGLVVVPDDAELLNVLAVIYIHEAKWDESEEILRNITVKNPRFFMAYLNLGRLLEEKGLFDEAMEVYKNLLSNLTSNYERGITWLRIGELYEKKGLEDFAKETYYYVIDIFPEENIVKSIAQEKLDQQ